jgi:CarD family transcriptional regulator
MNTRTFKEGDFVVYPAHGVGKIIGIECFEVEGYKTELLVVSFERDRMILKLPIKKAQFAGLRHLSSKEEMVHAFDNLKQKARVRRVMWSRRAQEYETKINSGDPKAIAEVIRDLYKSTTQIDQSYSERQIYQIAIERFARELAAIEQIDENSAIAKVEDVLKKAA